MGKMYFPDEIDNFKKEKSKNWLNAVWNWVFEESVIRTWVIAIILWVLSFIIWGFLL